MLLTISTELFAQKADPPKPDAVKLPAVAEILAKYVKAIGGREANEKIKTRKMTGTVELAPLGVKGTFESFTAVEARSFTKMNLAGIGEFTEVFDGKASWSSNPIQGSREKSGVELTQAKLTGNFYREINLDKLFQKMELKGLEKVGDKDAYVIVATAEGAPPETWYFDTISGLLLRSDTTVISPEGINPSKTYYDEMRAFDGALIPVKTRTLLGAVEINMTVTDVKNGVPIDDAIFTKPKQ